MKNLKRVSLAGLLLVSLAFSSCSSSNQEVASRKNLVNKSNFYIKDFALDYSQGNQGVLDVQLCLQNPSKYVGTYGTKSDGTEYVAGNVSVLIKDASGVTIIDDKVDDIVMGDKNYLSTYEESEVCATPIIYLDQLKSGESYSVSAMTDYSNVLKEPNEKDNSKSYEFTFNGIDLYFNEAVTFKPENTELYITPCLTAEKQNYQMIADVKVTVTGADGSLSSFVIEKTADGANLNSLICDTNAGAVVFYLGALESGDYKASFQVDYTSKYTETVEDNNTFDYTFSYTVPVAE